MLRRAATSETIGLMFSGGLDSAVLLGHLVRQGLCVQPFYISTGCRWEHVERRAVSRVLDAMRSEFILPLVDFAMPCDDVLAEHWSLHGGWVPDACSTDEAVYLPARNPLLLLKPLIWCGRYGIRSLAIATLANNPFADATSQFAKLFQMAMATATGTTVEIVRPFADRRKEDVVSIGVGLPLHLTFSCLSPQNDAHCGQCNKCAERERALSEQVSNDPANNLEFIAD